ncbi:MAG TPA: CinA family protein [Anaerolineaceae bacterium]|nr:CinA family protein [Anaerolineaceae bacterium]
MEEYLEVKIGPLLKELDYKLVVAESCTGGLISHRITNIPGSSEYYIGGVCAYAYEAKRSLLGVNPNTLNKFGAVSKQTVLEMAIGARRLFSEEVDFEKLIGISISGIAGPGGGMPNKPVGLVWVGLSTIDGDWARKKTFDGNRIQNKESSSDFALSILLEYLEGNRKPKKRGD